MPTDPKASQRPTGPDATRENLEDTFAYRGGGQTPADPVANPTVTAGAAAGGATKIPAGPAAATAVAGQQPPPTAQQDGQHARPVQAAEKARPGGHGHGLQGAEVGTDEIVAVKVLAKEMAARPGFIQRSSAKPA